MIRRPRRNHSAVFKTKVALAAIAFLRNFGLPGRVDIDKIEVKAA